MGIGSVTLLWLDALSDHGAFAGCRSIFELGPQDLFAPRHLVEHVVRKHVAAPEVAQLLEDIFRFSPTSARNQEAFYRIFGFETYSSCDVFDPRAQHQINLSAPIPDIGLCDCVTDFGTAEHVYSIGEVFRSIHRLLMPGGVALHVLPAFGDMNHGFYNIHPCLYLDVAAANGYEVLDFLYVDNMEIRCARQNALPDCRQLKEMDWSRYRSMTQIEISRMLSRQYASNVCSAETQAHLAANPNSYVVDYCFVAMRKPRKHSAFVDPLQNSTAGWAKEPCGNG
jgi:SAM-dependent methyltransferase